MDVVTEVMTQLLVLEGVETKMTASSEESAEFIASLTRAVAEHPYRTNPSALAVQVKVRAPASKEFRAFTETHMGRPLPPPPTTTGRSTSSTRGGGAGFRRGGLAPQHRARAAAMAAAKAINKDGKEDSGSNTRLYNTKLATWCSALQMVPGVSATKSVTGQRSEQLGEGGGTTRLHILCDKQHFFFLVFCLDSSRKSLNRVLFKARTTRFLWERCVCLYVQQSVCREEWARGVVGGSVSLFPFTLHCSLSILHSSCLSTLHSDYSFLLFPLILLLCDALAQYLFVGNAVTLLSSVCRAVNVLKHFSTCRQLIERYDRAASTDDRDHLLTVRLCRALTVAIFYLSKVSVVTSMPILYEGEPVDEHGCVRANAVPLEQFVSGYPQLNSCGC